MFLAAENNGKFYRFRVQKYIRFTRLSMLINRPIIIYNEFDFQQKAITYIRKNMLHKILLQSKVFFQNHLNYYQFDSLKM